jgi:ribosomal protein S18 acetylase RimI-like enzyme
MYRIQDQQEILPLIKEVRDLKKGMLTNYFPDPAKNRLWIEHGLLFVEKFRGTTFFFREDRGFYHVYFCTTSSGNLQTGLAELLLQNKEILYTIDLIGMSKDVAELGTVVESAGFYPYTNLVRMSRIISGSTGSEINKDPGLEEATLQDAREIHGQLQKFFDPLAENLPMIGEIESWINAGQIIIFRDDAAIGGFLIYEILGMTSYLRYWFVHPDHREKKIGSILINAFFQRSSGTKRTLFWVIQTNENAIKRYHHYGFLPENLFDKIYTNTNIRYGENNN